MFHTNKMPKIIVFRVVIGGTAPTEGSPTACHGKRPSCPKRAHARLPIQPWEAPFLSRAPQRPPSHPAPNASACIQLPHLRKPFSGAYLRPPVQPREAPFLSRAPRAPAFSSSPERERLHPASPPAKAIFGRIFAPASSFKLRLL